MWIIYDSLFYVDSKPSRLACLPTNNLWQQPIQRATGAEGCCERMNEPTLGRQLGYGTLYFTSFIVRGRVALGRRRIQRVLQPHAGLVFVTIWCLYRTLSEIAACI